MDQSISEDYKGYMQEILTNNTSIYTHKDAQQLNRHNIIKANYIKCTRAHTHKLNVSDKYFQIKWINYS